MENKKTSRIKAIIWVVLMDKKKQKITAGRDCDEVTAGELRDACCRKLRISSDGAEAFAIWICSPLLQIQMKPSHYPTALCDLWYDLLAQFSPVTESQAKSDQPIIMLMRNVFYPLSQEKMLIQRDPQARYYLTAESMFNFLTGRYPVEDELAFKLAAIQLKMEGKKMSNFPPGTLQNIANQILPWDVIKRNKKQSPIIDKKVRGYYNDLSNTTPGTLDHMYLSHWWTQACYRCAFFQGQVEVVGQKKDVPVRVGITPHNIFIWNKFTNKLMSTVESKNVTDANLVQGPDKEGAMDALIINFNIVGAVKKQSKTAVPIFSKQACMMNAMYSRLREENHLHSDKNTTSTLHTTVTSTDTDGALGRNMDFSNPTLKIGTKEVAVATKHISKKENIRGMTFSENGKMQKTKIRQGGKQELQFDV